MRHQHGGASRALAAARGTGCAAHHAERPACRLEHAPQLGRVCLDASGGSLVALATSPAHPAQQREPGPPPGLGPCTRTNDRRIGVGVAAASQLLPFRRW